MNLQVDNLSFSYNEHTILDDISMNVASGEFVGIIGPNGCGKSTLLKNLYRSLTPDTGSIYLDHKGFKDLKVKELARKLGVIGQDNTLPFDFAVNDIVAMGRSPHKKLFQSDTKEDMEIIQNALEKVDMHTMADKNYLYLSGGEKQRVLLARVLSQQTDFLILDEPTNHLDIHHQLRIFDVIKGLGATVLSAIHDLNIAALYCDRIYVMKDGSIYQSGTPEEILTTDIIQEVFNIKTDVRIHPVTKKVMITYLPESILNKGENNIEED
ncbi:heme ABC transporter ATP-binding protein [Halobacillus halophilus]|uniref:ABC-type transport system ATP-binding protein (Probable substrate iron complex) n=1 Tax=Halobacillus halophilus (strain ATCC 35676 / DSM 2266 / JCM 20832 / KCTC 3685 / LMG 17431 / NBRC 102448 / NCIMB 2269) TaxID=866895 RepID=I0JRA0_HALH3|nr:heme ABC transporter ATP-binding protein [Halobacillus halophilus]ASF40656.1 heme ABC transporter ATP-binding protein [Halobacillus halophilus]CCG46670.1 ABC-type transport system ATP-binding protein (probable substrate iron complex) [Halobacillus halophilus DSM 2266]